MKKIIFLIILLFLPFVVNAEELKLDWKTNWGYEKTSERFENAIIVNDGSIVSVGSTNSKKFMETANSCAMVVKYDSTGRKLWEKAFCLEGLASDFESVKVDKDNNIITLGWSRMHVTNDINAILVKWNQDGEILWQRSWGGTGEDYFTKLELDSENNIIIGGYMRSGNANGLVNKGQSDAVVVKYDDEGNVVWQKNWGSSASEGLDYMSITDKDEMIFAYVSNNCVFPSMYNKNNENIKFGGSGWCHEKTAATLQFETLELTNDGGIIMYVSESYKEQYAIKISYGPVDWAKKLDENIGISNFFVTPAEEYIIIGTSSSIEGLEIKGSSDIVILKYDKDWNIISKTAWGGTGSESINKIIYNKDNEIFILGSTNSKDIEGLSVDENTQEILLKFNTEGNILFQQNVDWGGTLNSSGYNSNDMINNFFLSNDKEIVLVGETDAIDIEGIQNESGLEAMIAKYSIRCTIENISKQEDNGTAIIEENGEYGIVTASPNEGYEVDKIIIRDKDGNVLDVELTQIEDGKYSFKLFTDVSVEVTFKEKIENPKTGILDVITILFTGMIISLGGFFLVKNYNERYEM